MYVYLFFQSTEDVIWQTKSIAKSCIVYSQERPMENPNVYMDRRDHTRWKIYILCHMKEILKR